MQVERIAVLIPAWKPDQSLIALVSSLLELSFGAIVIVDDGSGAGFNSIFEQLAQNGRVRLIRHSANAGKGRALKTGMRYFLDHLADFDGVVTCDADGQHHPADVRAVAEFLDREPGKLILGSRRFSGSVPLRSHAGNALTRHVFAFLTGATLRDTQSGLRAIPRKLIPRMLHVKGDRYDYEMKVLAETAGSCGVAEVPIRTIYIDGNRSSHFHPFWDSMRIYLVLARFYLSSLIAAAIDLVIFAIIFWITTSLLASVVCGRASSIANFFLNHRLVFRSGSGATVVWIRYYGLAVVIAAASYSGTRLLSRSLGMNVLAAKVLVEVVLSLLSLSIQRSYVFQIWARQ